MEGVTVSDELLSYKIMEPWGGEVFLSKCLIIGYPTIPSLQADFFLEPIVLNITYDLIASIKTATEAYRNLRQHYSYHPPSNSIGATTLQPTFIDCNFPPRLELLSSLVTLQASIFISRFELRVLTLNDREENEKGAAATHLLSSLPERLKDCVTLLLSEYEQHAVDTTHNKCPNYGLDAAFQMFHQRCYVILGSTLESTKIKAVRNAAEAIYNDIISGHGNMVEESERDLAINDAVRLLMDSNIINQEQYPRKVDSHSLIVLCIWDWKVSLLQLVYDTRFDISAGGLNVVDGLGYTIMSWLKTTSGKNRSSFGIGDMEELANGGINLKNDRQDSTQGNYEKNNRNRRRRRNKSGGSIEDGLKKVIQAAAYEAALSKQESAILCSIVIQDDKYIFGLGGAPLAPLTNATTMPEMYGMQCLAAVEEVEPSSLCKDREVRLTLEGGLIDITIDPQSLELMYYSLRRLQGAIGLQTRKINATIPCPDIHPTRKKTPSIHQRSTMVSSNCLECER